MKLHPHITIHELNQYCALCHEQKVRSVTIDPHTHDRIRTLIQNTTYQGISFYKKMNDTTIDLTLTLAQSIASYLKINQEWRAAWRYQHKREQLKAPRAKAFTIAEAHRNTLHEHLLTIPEPQFLALQARKLIDLWDQRTANFNIYKDHPHGENLRRLNASEQNLKTHLKAIHEIISKLS